MKWTFEPGEFNMDHGTYQIGSIGTPEGLWFAAVELGCSLETTTEEFIDRVLKVLNRELPDGKPRVRRKGVKSGKACGSED